MTHEPPDALGAGALALAGAKRSDEFGRLLSGAINSIAQYEAKTAPVIEDSLGRLAGLSRASIQRYKRGYVPPEPRTVQILADAAVKRGFLNRRWLIRFLRAAAYPAPDALLDALCPATATASETGPGPVLQNLPPPSYAQFITRERPFAEVVEALRQRTALVVVSSLGGMGKTSLVREVAAQCLRGDAELPAFDAAVWVSDAERPGTLTLEAVLDEIARTLNSDGLVDRGLEDKRRGVEMLLRSRRILVIVDNFETVTDAPLLKWLLKLPEPSKAVITTREYRREYRQGAWPVDLRGMTEPEARDFLAQRLRMLRLDTAVLSGEATAQLIAATGGNPKAMTMALGGLKYAQRPAADIIDDVLAARGDLFQELLERSWSMLDEAARRVLLAAALFAPSADADALAAVADVRPAAMTRAIERLADLSLLDVLGGDLGRRPRYALHPLVRAYAGQELAKDGAFANAARERAVEWYGALAARVGYCRDSLDRLKLLDPERDMLHVVLAWAREQGRPERILGLAEGAGYYCYVRGLMNRIPDVNLLAADAAHTLGKPTEELRWLAYHVQRKARSGALDEVAAYLPQVQALAEAHPMSPEAAEVYRHALATYFVAAGRPAEAEREWRALLSVDGITEVSRLLAVRWLATLLREAGRLDEARALLGGAIASASGAANIRAVVALQLLLCRVLLDAGAEGEAVALLAEARQAVVAHEIDRHVPDLLAVEGQVAAARGEIDRARAAWVEAADRFRRIGLQREVADVEGRLRGLGAG